MLIIAAIYAALPSSDWAFVAVPAIATIVAALIGARAIGRSKKKPNVDLKKRHKDAQPLDTTTEGFIKVINEISRLRQECADLLDVMERKYAVLEERYHNLEENFKALQERYERAGRV